MMRGTVTGTGPLRVQVDGASSASAAVTFDHVTLTTSDRVWCRRHGARLFVYGVIA